MSLRHASLIALGCTALAFGAAAAQSTSIHTNPDGSLSGSVQTPGSPGVSVQAGNGQAATHTGGRGDAQGARRPDGASSATVTAGPNGQAWASAGGDAYSCPNGAAVTMSSGPNGTTASCGATASGVWATAGDGQARSGVIPAGAAYRPPARVTRQTVHPTRVRHTARAHRHRRHRT
jgi:hypothetical protein